MRSRHFHERAARKLIPLLLAGAQVRAALWLLLLIQAALLAWINHPWLTGDSPQYLRLAASLAEGGYGELIDGKFEPDPLRPPGYPGVLSLLVHGLGLSLAAVVAIQAGLCLLSAWLIERHLRARGIGGNLFLLLWAAYPFVLLYGTFIQAEAWTILAITGVALLVDAKDPSVPALLAAGALSGLATLFRSDLAIVAVGAAAFVILRTSNRQWADRLGRASLIPLVAGLLLLPYGLWNLSTWGRFTPVPIGSAVGNSLYTATWSGVLPTEDIIAFPGTITPAARAAGLPQDVARVNRSIGADPLVAPFNPAKYPTRAQQIASTEATRAAAVRRIKADPLQYARLVLGNFWYLWNTSRYPPGLPGVVALGLALVSGLVFLAGAAGAAVSLFKHREWPVGYGPALIMACPFAVHVLLHTEARYTASVRPLLLMYAAVLITVLITRAWPTKAEDRSDRPQPVDPALASAR